MPNKKNEVTADQSSNTDDLFKLADYKDISPKLIPVLPRNELLEELETPDHLHKADSGWVHLREERHFPIPQARFMGKLLAQIASQWVYQRTSYRVPAITLSKYANALILPHQFLLVPEKKALSSDFCEELTIATDEVWYKDEESFTRNDQSYCIPRLSSNAQWREKNMVDISHAEGKVVREIKGPALFLTSWYHNNVSHWLLDLLPRLWGLSFIRESDIKIIIPAGHPPFIKESLELLGISSDRIVPINNGSVYKCDQLYNISRLASQYNFIAPELIDFYNFLPNYVQNFTSKKFDKIYISRRDTDNRPMISEEELERELEKRDFKVIRLTELTFPERMSYLSGATLVMSACGAGMAHAVMMQDNTHLIVTGTPDMHFHSNMYLNIAAQKNQTVSMICGVNIDNKSRTHDRWDMDVADTLKQVDRILLDI